jgi:xanthine/CO dehydrogenase XdhC/CoxF family maturation factor
LVETAIELRNGNGLPDLAHKARKMLSEEGFQVKIIGNHIDFGMEQTTIYYRPGAEKVARVLQNKFFRTAKLEEKAALTKVDVKIVMGHDLAKQQEVLAWAGASAQPVTTPPPAQPKATSPTAAAAVSPEPKPLKRPQLTRDELVETAIELRNGNGLPDLAHKAREVLSEEGFQIKIIGNHIDFGMEQTTIYYRPGAEKVARVLQDKFFRTAKLEEKTSLAKADVKIVMGHDLAKDLEVVALAGERGRP